MADRIFLTALIIESETSIMNQIVDVMTTHNIECLKADNGLIGLQKIENHEIDFVIADLKMKKMDGIQFIEVIRRNHQDLPVVATTGFSDDETIINAFRAGATNVIKKLERLDELENIILPITHLIEKRKQRKFDINTIRYFSEELNVSNDTAQVPITVEHLLANLKDSGFAERITGLEVALYEMIANAIEHGNLTITKEEKEKALASSEFQQLVNERKLDPRYKDRLVRIKMNYNPNQLNVTITDEGDGFDSSRFTSTQELNILAHSGRGILMSKMYVDEIRYNAKGNQVTLILNTDNDDGYKPKPEQFSQPAFSGHLLIVDHNPQDLRHISRLLLEMGYSCGYIANSSHLIPRLEFDSFDLLLMNVDMQDIDGVSLLETLQGHAIFRRIPTIMLTTDKNDRLMAECFARGAEDFIQKPVSKLVLKSRIESVLHKREAMHQIRMSNEKLALLNNQLKEQYDTLLNTQAELKEKHQQIEEDIALAERIQSSVMTSKTELDYLETGIVYKPLSVVSGDFYHMFEDSYGNFNLFLGDATGHGVSAAFLTMMVRVAIGMTGADLPPNLIIRKLNAQLASCIPKGNHMTGILLKISENGRLIGCNAGSPMCLLARGGELKRIFSESGGLALGMFSDQRVPYQNESFSLLPGDRIIVCTDGLMERRNSGRVAFGSNEFMASLSRNIRKPIQKALDLLYDDAEKFAGNVNATDDVTIIGLGFKTRS